MASRRHLSNVDIASQLEEMASVLRADGADKWRVRAYEEAARTVRGLRVSVVDILERDGRPGLIALPAIGEGIAHRIEDMAFGRDASGEQLMIFEDAPPAPPPKPPAPSRAVRDLFESQVPPPPDARPPIGLLIQLDLRFREKVGRSDRTDQTRGEWLPTWEVMESGWSFTVRFSRTRAAQKMGRTHDWVVVEWERDKEHGQSTLVTEYRGPLNGRRVVRGHERECLKWWADETRRQADERRWSRIA